MVLLLLRWYHASSTTCCIVLVLDNLLIVGTWMHTSCDYTDHVSHTERNGTHTYRFYDYDSDLRYRRISRTVCVEQQPCQTQWSFWYFSLSLLPIKTIASKISSTCSWILLIFCRYTYILHVYYVYFELAYLFILYLGTYYTYWYWKYIIYVKYNVSEHYI